MSASTEGMKGPRLEFVVREQKGEVTRAKHSVDPKQRKIIVSPEKVPAGYIVYMPNGNSYRLTREELVKRGYDRQPTIINFESVSDTKTPAGRYKFAMDDKTRKVAWKALEEQVIKSCVRRHGPVGGTGDVQHDSASA